MKNTTLFLFLFCIPFWGISQSLSGKIVDQNNQVVIGAQVYNLANYAHSHSNEKGLFLLDNVAVGDTVVVSFFGYEASQTVVKTLDESIKIKLTEKPLLLDEVLISPGLNTLQLIADVDISLEPVNSAQEVLRQVPGLFIGQHAGGGKAEQIFLRGFDIDHGTDIGITVDGLPVNMVSHAHGQGYADLHFLIPETIDNIQFDKGPYNASKGNFVTAGYVNFETKDILESNEIKFEVGQFNTLRSLAMFNIAKKETQSGYVAAEFLQSDGPFESPQNFQRINVFGKYNVEITPNDQIGITLSHFTSNWDASGQIPQRAVDDGSITRFGAIDDTEGGETSRTNVLVNYDKILSDQSFIRNSLFFSHYDFELFSNFTFFLEDPVNGDQIRQFESRNIFGLNSEYVSGFNLPKAEGDWRIGMSLRTDQVNDNELSRTLNRRETLEQIQVGDVIETNIGLYASSRFEIGDWTIQPGIRVDYFDFQYIDQLQTTFERQSTTVSLVSPKLNILYQPTQNLQFFWKAGQGFHSNDTRVSVAQNGQQVLPAAYGTDIGFSWKPTPKLLINTAYWYLFLQQEFVYVGDAGIVEPSGQTKRHGTDLSIRYQILDWLFWNLDGTYTYARALDTEPGEGLIPLAPNFTLTSGLNWQHPAGFQGGVQVRHLADRAANEDNSIVAEGYTIVDLNAGYQWKSFNFGVQIQNLFDSDWNETQFATESRLANELEPVEEIHFTPGTPFFIRGIIGFSF